MRHRPTWWIFAHMHDAADAPAGARTVRARWALYDFRHERGLPQKLLASILAVTTAALYEIEIGARDPTPNDLARFAQVFALDPATTFELSDRVPPPKRVVPRSPRARRLRRPAFGGVTP